MRTTGIEDRLDVSCNLAVRVGRRAAEFRRSSSASGLGVELKGAQDFVTLADREAERDIRTTLQQAFPGDGFVGEETGGAPADTGYWVVDPIDGTANFVHGFDYWSVSIAYVAAGYVEIGVVYDGGTGRLYSALRGKGAWCDATPIEASSITDASVAMAVIDYSGRVALSGYLDLIRGIHALGAEHRRFGSAALGLVQVGTGAADLFYEEHLNSWDTLAGALIAAEAGAQVFVPPLPDFMTAGGPTFACAPGILPAFAFIGEAARSASGGRDLVEFNRW